MHKWSGEKMKETNFMPHTMEVTYFNVSARTQRLFEYSSFRRLPGLVVCKSWGPTLATAPLGNTEIILNELGALAVSLNKHGVEA